MGTTIKCCKDCVPPKRHIGCHGYCEEYIEEKIRIEQEKKMEREKSERSRVLNPYSWTGAGKPAKRRK